MLLLKINFQKHSLKNNNLNHIKQERVIFKTRQPSLSNGDKYFI
jgi:hypothetical protein